MKKWQAFVGVVLVAATSSWPKSSPVVTAGQRNPLVQIVEKLVVRPLQHRGRRRLCRSRQIGPRCLTQKDAQRDERGQMTRWMSDS